MIITPFLALTARICSKQCAVQREVSEASQEALDEVPEQIPTLNHIRIFICVPLHNRLQPRRLVLCCGMGIYFQEMAMDAQCPAI